MITSVVVVAAVVFNDAAAMTPIVTNYCDGRREGKAKVKTKNNCLGEKCNFCTLFNLRILTLITLHYLSSTFH